MCGIGHLVENDKTSQNIWWKMTKRLKTFGGKARFAYLRMQNRVIWKIMQPISGERYMMPCYAGNMSATVTLRC